MNLRRAEERLKRLREGFDAAGLSFKRVEAVDGRNLTTAQIERFVRKVGRWGRLTPGEIGCFLSHRACWRELLQNGDCFAAVLEDDVVLGENAAAVLLDDYWLPDDAQMVKIETAGSRVFLDTTPRGEIDGRKLFRLRSSHYCSAAYIVSRDCAERLLAESETFCEAIDDYLFSSLSPVFSQTTVYQLTPAVCIQSHAMRGDGKTQEVSTSIEGREAKQRGRLSFGERLREVCVKERQSGVNKVLAMLRKRRRQTVEFR